MAMTAKITVDNDEVSLWEARYQAMALSIKIDGVVEVYYADDRFIYRFDKGNQIKVVQTQKTEDAES